MSWLPIGADQWTAWRDLTATKPDAKVTTRLLIASLLLRTVFIVSLVIVTVHVAMPQSSSILRAYDSLGDMVRLGLGLAVCGWVAVQAFTMPKDRHAHRTWLYLGAVAVPFAVTCIIGIW